MLVQVSDAIRPFLQGALFQLQRLLTPIDFGLPVEGSGPVRQIACPAYFRQHLALNNFAQTMIRPSRVAESEIPKVMPVIVFNDLNIKIKAVLPHVPHMRKIVVSCSRMIGISLQKFCPVFTRFFQRVESPSIGLPGRYESFMAGNTVPHICRKSAVVKRSVKNPGAVARITDHLKMSWINAACLTGIRNATKGHGGKCYG